MKPIEEKRPNTDDRKPVQPKNEKDIRTDKEEDADSTVVLDIDKKSFTERPHGRTTEPLGPGHEPGTI